MKAWVMLAALWAQPVLAQTTPPQPVGTDQEAGSAPAPEPVHDRAADRYYPAEQMAAAEHWMMQGEAPSRFQAYRLDLAEARIGKGADGYHLEGEAWTGNLHRLVLRVRAEGDWGQRLEQGEIQAAYAYALGPWWTLQAGVRRDVGVQAQRNHAMIGLEGLSPYRFDILALGFVSDKGVVSARVEGSIDERLTRRIVLQPRVEVVALAQDDRQVRLGAGLSSIEAGLRIRYEITRKFAPYAGVNWGWSFGQTADYARMDGKPAAQRSFVLGVRSWY
jgi:copper resistance protein B